MFHPEHDHVLIQSGLELDWRVICVQQTHLWHINAIRFYPFEIVKQLQFQYVAVLIWWRWWWYGVTEQLCAKLLLTNGASTSYERLRKVLLFRKVDFLSPCKSPAGRILSPNCTHKTSLVGKVRLVGTRFMKGTKVSMLCLFKRPCPGCPDFLRGYRTTFLNAKI